jgi:hypothetical protein
MVLLHSNYPDIESNQLNKAKNRVFKSAVTQYTKVTDISQITPTQNQMNEYFFKITTILNQIIEQMRGIFNGVDPNKISLDFGPTITEFSNEFNLKIQPLYNYISTQQNQQILILINKI